MLNILLIVLIYLTGFNYPRLNIMLIIIMIGFNYYVIRKKLNGSNKQTKNLTDFAISLLCVLYFGYNLIRLTVYNFQLIPIKSVIVDCKDPLIKTINTALMNQNESYINNYIKNIQQNGYCQIPIKNVYTIDSIHLQITTLALGNSSLVIKDKKDSFIINQKSLYIK